LNSSLGTPLQRRNQSNYLRRQRRISRAAGLGALRNGGQHLSANVKMDVASVMPDSEWIAFDHYTLVALP
jgi:hypothetical protein